MERVTLEWTDRVDAGSHVPTVQVTTDIEDTTRHLFVIEIIRHRRTHFPPLAKTDVSVHAERMRELHVVLHLLVIERTSVGIRERIVDTQTPRNLRLYIPVIHLRFRLAAAEFGTLHRTVIAFLHRCQRRTSCTAALFFRRCLFALTALAFLALDAFFQLLKSLVAEGLTETPS